MKELNIAPNLPKKRTSSPRPNNNVYLINRIKKSFTRQHPNEVWVGDITSILIEDNIFYLCVILDLFSRMVIAYRVHYKNNANLTMNTFKDDYENRCDPKGTIFHSDRGTQYTAFEYRQLLRFLGIKSSFSNTGNPYDNAVVEAFFSNLKKEEVNRNQYTTFEELDKSISEYIDF